MGLSKADVAERARCSRQMVGAVEAGSANPTLAMVDDILRAIDVELDLVVRSSVVLGGSPRSQDAAHAVCSGHVQRRLETAGFEVHREVRIGSGRYIGWIDLLAYHEPSGTLLIIEIKTRIDDLGAIERSLDWYASQASAISTERLWRPTRIVPWLLVLATDEVEARLRRDRLAIERIFPLRAPAMQAMLRPEVEDSPSRQSRRAVRMASGLALIDPHSRRSDWLIRSKLDGRRSPAPYLGYVDYMRRHA